MAPYGIDWVKEFENGTYQHTAEPRHATFAITDTAVQHMQVYDHMTTDICFAFEFFLCFLCIAYCMNMADFRTIKIKSMMGKRHCSFM